MINLEKLIKTKNDRNLILCKNNNCEYIEGLGIAHDQDFEDLLFELKIGCVLNYCKVENKEYSLFYQNNFRILVLTTDMPNRHDEDCGDETFFDFNNFTT